MHLRPLGHLSWASRPRGSEADVRLEGRRDARGVALDRYRLHGRKRAMGVRPYARSHGRSPRKPRGTGREERADGLRDLRLERGVARAVPAEAARDRTLGAGTRRLAERVGFLVGRRLRRLPPRDLRGRCATSRAKRGWCPSTRAEGEERRLNPRAPRLDVRCGPSLGWYGSNPTLTDLDAQGANGAESFATWRREWDSNPRYPYGHT